jgi:hypothetical protein
MVTIIFLTVAVQRNGASVAGITVTVKVSKGKAVPLHAMEALGGRGGIAPTHS